MGVWGCGARGRGGGRPGTPGRRPGGAAAVGAGGQGERQRSREQKVLESKHGTRVHLHAAVDGGKASLWACKGRSMCSSLPTDFKSPAVAGGGGGGGRWPPAPSPPPVAYRRERRGLRRSAACLHKEERILKELGQVAATAARRRRPRPPLPRSPLPAPSIQLAAPPSPRRTPVKLPCCSLLKLARFFSLLSMLI